MAGTITIEIPNNLVWENRKLNLRHVLDMTQWDETVRNQMAFCLIMNGWTQKMNDATALSNATDGEKAENVRRVFVNLQNGIWAERGGKRLNPVLAELRDLVQRHGIMKAEEARKADDADIDAACNRRDPSGKLLAALRRKAQQLVDLRMGDLELPEPDLG